MNSSQIYILISIVVLAVIAAVLFIFRGKKPVGKLSTLGGLSLALMVAGIVFGESRLIGYSLIGAGVILAIVDMVRKLRK